MLSSCLLLMHWMKRSNIDCQIIVIENSFLNDLNHAREINHKVESSGEYQALASRFLIINLTKVYNCMTMLEG